MICLVIYFPPFFTFVQLEPEPAPIPPPLLYGIATISLKMSKILNYVKSRLQALDEDLVVGIEGRIVGRIPIWKEEMVSLNLLVYSKNSILYYNLEQLI